MAARWHKQQKITTLIGIGIITGMAVLCKWLSGLVVVPVWTAMCLPYVRQEPKRYIAYLFMVIVTIAVVVLPWQWYILTHYPAEAKWEYYYNTLHLYKGLKSHEGGIFYHADKIRQIYGEAVYLPILWFTYVVIKNKEVRSYWVLMWFWAVFLFFSIAATKMRAYTVIAAPAIFMMIARFAEVMWEQARTMNRGKVWLRIVVIAAIALPIRYAVERAKFLDSTDRNPEWVKELQALNSRHIEKGVLFNYDAPIEAMFETGLTAYTDIPDKARIETLIAEGHTVLINDKWNVPEEVINMNGVEMVKIRTDE
jgi:4-amino-4-deoxy-L-arabinose transferase